MHNDKTWLGGGTAAEDLGGRVDRKLNRSRRHAAAVRKANVVLGSMNRSVGGKPREATVPLCVAGEASTGELGPVQGAALQRSFGQTGERAEESNKKDQRFRKPVLRGQVEVALVLLQLGTAQGPSRPMVLALSG